jgi:hypothetical protein
MSTEVTLRLSDDVVRRAKRMATMSGSKLESVLAQAVELSFTPLDSKIDPMTPMSSLSDSEVLAICSLEMARKDDIRLSRLLNKNQAGTLKESGKQELDALMKLYQAGLLRKAQALREAVRRGLREPLTP